MIVRDKKTDEYVGIQCSAPGCEVMAPPAREIMNGHGLNRMGWECLGGKHLCPAHARPLVGQHMAQRQQDEYFCARCRKRWGADEDAPEKCA